MNLSQCPYDGTAIEAEACSGGSVLVSCPCCGAAWEWHSALLRRVRDPDQEAVRAAQEARAAGHLESSATTTPS